jgi:hypothetical protein
MTEFLYTLVVGHAGSTASIEADTMAPAALEPRVGRYFAVDTALSEPFGARPDCGAVPAVTKPIAALAVFRTVAIRHILGPGSRREDHALDQTILGDRLVEWRERVLMQVARPHGSLCRGYRFRCFRGRILGAPA